MTAPVNREIDAVLDGSQIRKTVLVLLLQNLLVVFCIRFLLPALQNHLEKSVSQRIFLDMEVRVAEKKCTIPWFCHEDPGINDRMELLRDISSQVWLYFKGITNIAAIAASTIGMFLLMMRLGVFFVLFLLLLLRLPWCSSEWFRQVHACEAAVRAL